VISSVNYCKNNQNHQHKNNMKKNLITIIVLTILSGLSYAGYSAYKTNKRSKQWKNEYQAIQEKFIQQQLCVPTNNPEIKTHCNKKEKIYKSPKKISVTGSIYDFKKKPIKWVNIILQNKKQKFPTDNIGSFGYEIEVKENIDLRLEKTGYAPIYKILRLSKLNLFNKYKEITNKASTYLFNLNIQTKKIPYQKLKIRKNYATRAILKLNNERPIEIVFPKNMIKDRNKVYSGEAIIQIALYNPKNPKDLRIIPKLNSFDKVIGINLNRKTEEINDWIFLIQIYKKDSYSMTPLNAKSFFIKIPTDNLNLTKPPRYWKYNIKSGFWEVNTPLINIINNNTKFWILKIKN